MSWKFNNEAPIYLQIMDEIKLRIAKGALKPGDKVPPVRELAVRAGVNPNTMQKALAELEREGVLYSQRTAGRFVADKDEGDDSMRDEICKKYIESYIKGMRELGFSDDRLIQKLKLYMEEEEKNG